MTDPERRRFYRGRPMSGAEVEETIERLMDDLEDDLDELRDLEVDAAKAEAAYRSERARLLLTAPDTYKTDTRRAAYAEYHAGALFEARKIAEALASSFEESMRVHRADLEALRTIAANARAAEHGRG